MKVMDELIVIVKDRVMARWWDVMMSSARMNGYVLSSTVHVFDSDLFHPLVPPNLCGPN